MNKRTACLLGFLLPMLAMAEEPGLEEFSREDWNAKFQTTYIWQHKPGFHAAYSGANSLSAYAENSNTFTTDAYVGVRLGPGSELYLVPEVTLGVPFTNLTGLGGFTNGEITRTSGTRPMLYRQQLFLRQSWGQGGGAQHLASGMNQLAGAVDSNRFVLTAGNFSTLNIFDNNAYAHDPRTQFMNWSNMTHGSYDYAADARGFGWGVAGEWYRDAWVVRAARMTVPRDPNMLQLDFQLARHYGDQLEIERAHELEGLPGKVRLLAWRNRAKLANYRDALAYGQAHNQAPDIFKVRYGEQIKYGFGINLEQAVSDNLGAFLRAMQADGRSETQSFTETDSSIAGGLALKGASWGRAQDTAGIALMSNGLSKDRREYLQAGGISFFIGDGALRYRPETIFETYYSWNAVRNFWLTADYQHINNPAYNAERGPVEVFGVRVHLEY